MNIQKKTNNLDPRRICLNYVSGSKEKQREKFIVETLLVI